MFALLFTLPNIITQTQCFFNRERLLLMKQNLLMQLLFRMLFTQLPLNCTRLFYSNMMLCKIPNICCNFIVCTLQYNTKYYYKIGSGASAREFWFETPPAIDPDASYTFGIIGLSFLI